MSPRGTSTFLRVNDHGKEIQEACSEEAGGQEKARAEEEAHRERTGISERFFRSDSRILGAPAPASGVTIDS